MLWLSQTGDPRAPAFFEQVLQRWQSDEKTTLNERCTMKNVDPAELSAFCIVHFAFQAAVFSSLLVLVACGCRPFD